MSLGLVYGPMVGKPSIDKPWLKFYSDEAILSDAPYNISIYKCMKDKNIDCPNRIAINYYGKTYTYQEMFDMIDKLANCFKSLGVTKGDIVSICMPSTPETVFSFYALNKLGAICDMIDPRSNPEQMTYYLTQNKSKILILCENYYKILQDAICNKNLDKVILTSIGVSAPFIKKILIDIKTMLDMAFVSPQSNIMTWRDLTQMKMDAVVDDDLVLGDDVALIIHSSGTTSLPKGIMLTNDNINALSYQYKLTSLNTEPGSRFLSVIPAFASFGMVASLDLPFKLSMENYLYPIVSPKIFAKALVKNKINFTLTIPGNFKYVVRQKKIRDLSFLTGPGSGGYSLNSSEELEIQEGLKEKKCSAPMLMGFGMSELSSTACLETPECSKILSSGIPLVKNNISIFKLGTDYECNYDEEGEICISGPTVMKGYFNNDEKTKKTIIKHKDGKYWLHSGDLGSMDADGRLIPSGRSERIIIKGADGFKINPQKLEEVIALSKYVDEVTVVGYNDPVCGVIPVAYITIKNEFLGMENDAIKEINELCHQKLSIRAIPDKFVILDKMPFTLMEKIDFRLLEKGVFDKTVMIKDKHKKLIRKN